MLIMMVATVVYAQNDPIIGKWQNPSAEGRVEIYKKGDQYFGKLYWMKAPNDAKGIPKKDAKNPDKKLQSRELQGVELLTNFTKKSGGTYEGGQIYDPKSGKTYSCKMSLKGEDKLDIRGFLGLSILGRTETWTRIK